MTVVAVHLLTLLQDRGLTLAAAVGLGALIGPSQVGGRVLEMTFGRTAHPIWSLLASSMLVAVGLGMLIGTPRAAAVCIVLYGMGSGIRSIARGTVPLAIFGREGYAILMGRLSLPTLLATATAPMVGAWLLGWVRPTGTLVFLFGAALLHVALVVPLMPMALRSGDGREHLGGGGRQAQAEQAPADKGADAGARDHHDHEDPVAAKDAEALSGLGYNA